MEAVNKYHSILENTDMGKGDMAIKLQAFSFLTFSPGP